jgi:hypothetical protein
MLLLLFHWIADGLRHGNGKCILPNGVVHEGQCVQSICSCIAVYTRATPCKIHHMCTVCILQGGVLRPVCARQSKL